MAMKYVYWKWGNGRTENRSGLVQQEKTFVDKIEKRQQNDRELNCERLSQREMVIQTSINPFLTDHNYLSDLQVQDEFLRPKDSNIKIAKE